MPARIPGSPPVGAQCGEQVPLRLKSAKELLHCIDKNFSTLAFCRRWLEDLGQTRHLMALKSLVDNDLVQVSSGLCTISISKFTLTAGHPCLRQKSKQGHA